MYMGIFLYHLHVNLKKTELECTQDCLPLFELDDKKINVISVQSKSNNLDKFILLKMFHKKESLHQHRRPALSAADTVRPFPNFLCKLI